MEKAIITNGVLGHMTQATRSPDLSPDEKWLPESSRLPVMPLPWVAGADVPVVLVAYAGLAKVSGIVSSWVVFRVLRSGDAAVAEKIPHSCERDAPGRLTFVFTPFWRHSDSSQLHVFGLSEGPDTDRLT